MGIHHTFRSGLSASVAAVSAPNMIEIRSDVFKLTTALQRPVVYSAKDMGPWEDILTCMVWLAAVTNVLIVGLTSEQLKTLFPSYFLDLGDTHAARKEGIALMAVIEHTLLVVGMLITWLIDPVPQSVKDERAHREYERTRNPKVKKKNE